MWNIYRRDWHPPTVVILTFDAVVFLFLKKIHVSTRVYALSRRLISININYAAAGRTRRDRRRRRVTFRRPVYSRFVVTREKTREHRVGNGLGYNKSDNINVESQTLPTGRTRHGEDNGQGAAGSDFSFRYFLFYRRPADGEICSPRRMPLVFAHAPVSDFILLRARVSDARSVQTRPLISLLYVTKATRTHDVTIAYRTICNGA